MRNIAIQQTCDSVTMWRPPKTGVPEEWLPVDRCANNKLSIKTGANHIAVNQYRRVSIKAGIIQIGVNQNSSQWKQMSIKTGVFQWKQALFKSHWLSSVRSMCHTPVQITLTKAAPKRLVSSALISPLKTMKILIAHTFMTLLMEMRTVLFCV